MEKLINDLNNAINSFLNDEVNSFLKDLQSYVEYVLDFLEECEDIEENN